MIFNQIKNIFFILILLSSYSLAAYHYPEVAHNGMVASPHPLATEIATQILQDGGNAIDAALAAAFALSVVEQYHSGIGGGEFAVIWWAKTKQAFSLDARECAPNGLSLNLFIDSLTGKPFPFKSKRGGLSVGIPGSVAGRIELHRKFGTISLKDIIQPSIKLARNGFALDRYYADRLKDNQDRFSNDSNIVKVFFHNNKPLESGEVLIQPSLAATLEQIAKDNGKSFYHGEQARYIVNAVNKSGGVFSLQDMANYKVIWREPVKFNYRNIEGYSMPPPSSGGVCIALILNMLEGLPLSYIENYSSEYYHTLASVFEKAYIERAKWLADPDFVPQPVNGLISKPYADSLRKSINRHFHLPTKDAGDPWIYESVNTSHISVIDHEGNMCAITTSINSGFGSLIYVPELGIFLNNTLDDFTISSLQSNQYDFVQGEVNCVEPGKRPLSSMSPTVILKDGKPYLCVGSVGGPRIITSVVQIIVNIVDYNMDIQSAIDAPRIHYQWKPDTIFVEAEISPDITTNLRTKNWNIVKGKTWSLSQGVMFDASKGIFFGASDARGIGTAKGY